jgi:hypothetical protein
MANRDHEKTTTAKPACTAIFSADERPSRVFGLAHHISLCILHCNFSADEALLMVSVLHSLVVWK